MTAGRLLRSRLSGLVLAIGLATAGGLFPGLHPGALAHGRNIRFDRISLEQGLSQSAINFKIGRAHV